jgi:hypothetical protein
MAKRHRTRAPTLVPMSDVVRPSSSATAKWAARAPRVVEIWERWGWGRYADGFLWFADPQQLEETLDQWLGGPCEHRVPLGRTGLGDLLYLRDLRDRARALGLKGRARDEAYDISVVDVRYKRVHVLATSVAELEQQLALPAWLDGVLRKDLFDAALERLGPPALDEIYGFVPALGLGGAEESSALHRVQADVHLEILFQL